jgi:hypothetical protein
MRGRGGRDRLVVGLQQPVSTSTNGKGRCFFQFPPPIKLTATI